MKKAVVTILSVAVLAAAFAYEWRYSAEMQEHIDTVNRDLESASLRSTFSTGLVGSLQTMTDEADVAGEILETRNYVHTLKDEMLARKIKEAAAQGVTVGGAMQNVIVQWHQSI